jgi:hypothetical protein
MTITPTAPDLAHEVAATLLTLLERRDFAGVAALVAPDAPVRALTPKGLSTGSGPAFLAERLDTWFGGDEAFAVEATALEPAGHKLHLCWRIALTDQAGVVRRAEQHVFVRASDRVDSLDLVCSGFWTVAA